MFTMTCYEGVKVTRTLFNGTNGRLGLSEFMRRHPEGTYFELHRASFDEEGFLIVGQIVESAVNTSLPVNGITVDYKQEK